MSSLSLLNRKKKIWIRNKKNKKLKRKKPKNSWINKKMKIIQLKKSQNLKRKNRNK